MTSAVCTDYSISLQSSDCWTGFCQPTSSQVSRDSQIQLIPSCFSKTSKSLPNPASAPPSTSAKPNVSNARKRPCPHSPRIVYPVVWDVRSGEVCYVCREFRGLFLQSIANAHSSFSILARIGSQPATHLLCTTKIPNFVCSANFFFSSSDPSILSNPSFTSLINSLNAYPNVALESSTSSTTNILRPSSPPPALLNLAPNVLKSNHCVRMTSFPREVSSVVPGRAS